MYSRYLPSYLLKISTKICNQDIYSKHLLRYLLKTSTQNIY